MRRLMRSSCLRAHPGVHMTAGAAGSRPFTTGTASRMRDRVVAHLSAQRNNLACLPNYAPDRGIISSQELFHLRVLNMSADKDDNAKKSDGIRKLINSGVEIAGGAVGSALGFFAGGPFGAAVLGAGGAAAAMA